MEPQNSRDALLAAALARPFLPSGQVGAPLSFRELPDGGMVVITPDGRKLWFTCAEANAVRRELRLAVVIPPKTEKKPEEIRYRRPAPPAPPHPLREGESVMIILPPDLKHLEKEFDAHSYLPRRQRPPASK